MDEHGILHQRVMTDTAYSYRYSPDFKRALGELAAKHLRTPFHHPQVNGKVERFNRTLLEEWAYVRVYDSNDQRLSLLTSWGHNYNFHPTHTAPGGRAPIERVNEAAGNSSYQPAAGRR